MKLTVCLGVPLLALLALPASVRADTPGASDEPVNPYAGVDPDGVPLSVTQEIKTPVTDQAAAQKQAVEDDARARNWLLLDYQKQLQRNNAESSANGQALNTYLQLSENKDYTPGASPDKTTPAAQPPPSFRAALNPSGPESHGMNLRGDPSASTGFTPLISPLSSPGILSASQPFNSGVFASPLPPSLVPGTTADGLPAMAAPASAPPPAPGRSGPVSPTETVDMQTPGMVADKTGPLPGAPDLSLDSLPDPNSNDLPQRPDAQAQLPQVAQAMDSDQLHAALDTKLKSPKVALNTTEKQVEQPPKPVVPPPPETPSPISQQPQISPVHAPLPSPFDILNR